MAEGEVRQYWVRNDRGTMWGPLTLPTIELLIESGSIQGRLQMSEDGLNFAFPWRFPEARDVVPRELWGPGAPAASAAEQAAPVGVVSGAPVVTGPGARPAAGPGVAPGAGPGAAPIAGPGVRPVAGPGVAPSAGPGAAPIAGPGVRPMAGPGAPIAGPGVRPMASPGAPIAGPGVRPMAGPGAAPMAGPGARPPEAPSRRPAAPAPHARPPGAVPPPPVAGAARPPSAPPASPAPASAPVAVPAVEGDDAAPEIPALGQLEQLSPFRLYGRVAAREQTGLLSLTLADRVVQIHFRKGNPEFVDSSHPEEALGPSLVAARLLTPAQLQQAEPALERFGGDLLTALFGLGLLQPATAFAILAQRAGGILSRGLRAEAGTFTFELKDLPSHKAMPLGHRWAVLSDTVRRIPSADLKRRLTPVLQLPIMKSGGVVAASELRLTPHEVRALTVIDGVRSVAQLLTDFAQDSDHLLRLAFLLKELDAVSFAGQARTAQDVGPRAPGAGGAQPSTGAQAANVAVGQQAAGAPRPAGAAPNVAGRPQPASATHASAQQRPAGAAPNVAGGPQPARGAQAAGAVPQRPVAGATPAAGPGATRPAGTAPTAGPGATAARPPVAGPGAAQPRPPPSLSAQGAQRPAAPAATATPANAPGAEEIPALRQLTMAMKQQNHFQRLGLTEQTNASAVKIAYFRLAKLYHPDTLPQGAPPELEKLKAEVFAYIGDAYRTLSDDNSRASYIEELKSGGSGDGVDINGILMAEELFQKSCILVKARKFPDAVKMLDEAIKLNPEEAEFYAWRGYARFFTAADKKAAQPEAFREIQNAIKRNERCAPAHYFLGVIAKLSGDAPGSLKHFKRTVELQPDHIDAQREIRMASQKK
ncbi:DnaJ domain-containing protein [Myxococcus sp. AM009]|uniref:J domain-containing protein n=1 Tax=unclassified Myxococcus TaxID=2648731 RepID=UPI001595A19A|nr:MULTISPECIES: DnaJ domain-containing protein [unclassified Myxococcus]NVJ02352.1 DnaJ domain-containing protein [Myxococcus sp. AM009]NVJ17607.1 DnaJ domain-containing protein [Myxococcus sp. AM010]